MLKKRMDKMSLDVRFDIIVDQTVWRKPDDI
jgi:hypothetical protein